jgi:hypothetical protein
MNAVEYPHPERLKIPSRLVLGGPDNWEVLEVFSTSATRLDGSPIPQTETIEVALLMPKHPEPEAGFEMLLARVHEEGLTTLAAEAISLSHHGSIQLSGTGFSGIYLFSDHPGEQRSTQEYREMGHTKKIAKLEEALKLYIDTITTRPGYLPAWQDAARNLAPAVAGFFLVDSEHAN